MTLWTDLLILQTIIGYCFVVANDSIGIYNIRDLNNMKGDLVFVKAHKIIGWIETIFFYAIAIQCVIMAFQMWMPSYVDLTDTPAWHVMIGGIGGGVLFTFKFIIARFFKDTIYKIGWLVGPIGFIGWSLAHFTSLVNYYFHVVNLPGYTITPIIPQSFIFAGFPEPKDINISAFSRFKGAPPAFTVPATKPRYHATVLFDEPITGPVLVGRLRYFGIGLFRPMRSLDSGDVR